MILGLLLTRCAPSMAQTSWSINAGTAALWLFSSALAPHTSATLAMMTSSEWPVSPRRNCPIVLQVLLSALLWKMLNYSECTWLGGGWHRKKNRKDRWHIVLSFLSQGPKASSWRVLSALYMWFIHQQGRSSPWAVGSAEMPTLSKQQDFTENQFVYCDFCLRLKPRHETKLLHGQVSRTLDQGSALRRESSGLLSCWHQYPSCAMGTGCGSFGFKVTWMKKNNRVLKKKKKTNKITCDVFACGRCIPSASINVAHLLIAQV